MVKSTDILIYESPKPTKIRALTWFAAVVMVFCAVAATFVFEHMTENEGSPELASLTMRLMMSTIIGGIGIGMFAAMLIYLTYYTTRLKTNARGDQIYVETLRLIGTATRTLKSTQIDSSAYHHGQLNLVRAPSVDAPWFWVKVISGKGFLLDLHGTVMDVDALTGLLTANWRKPIDHLDDVLRVRSD
jgi:hypothetical protein